MAHQDFDRRIPTYLLYPGSLKHCARIFMLGVNGLGTAGLLVCIAYES